MILDALKYWENQKKLRKRDLEIVQLNLRILELEQKVNQAGGEAGPLPESREPTDEGSGTAPPADLDTSENLLVAMIRNECHTKRSRNYSLRWNPDCITNLLGFTLFDGYATIGGTFTFDPKDTAAEKIRKGREFIESRVAMNLKK